MRNYVAVILIGLSLSRFAAAQAPATQPRQVIEICFVLDTTGSMSGLIEGAKAKIWSITNQIIHIEPRPQVYIGLVGYRDRNDEYITKVFDLTDDIDQVYKNLQTFRADGGGDGPESVNQALAECASRIHWSRDRNITKMVFLVGDAPPHMDYPDDVKYQQTCSEAVKRDLIINTVQCGSDSGTMPIWQEIARLGEGSYIALQQDGNMLAMNSPYDKEIAELNVKVNETVLAYGDRAQQSNVFGSVSVFGGGGMGGAGGGRMAAAPAASAAPTTSTVDRAVVLASMRKSVGGRGDLLDDLKSGAVKLEDVKVEELPEQLRSMTPEQRKEYLARQSAARAELQTRINSLAQQRQDYITTEQRRLAEQTGNKDSFDAAVGEVVQHELAKKK